MCDDVTIEWMQYPVCEECSEDQMVITWSDGSIDTVPTHDGDGEMIFELPRLMEEIFRVENFNCSEGQSGQFIDQYPTLFRSDSGVLVLRVISEESFMNAFICQSRDASECLLSWMGGDIRTSLSDQKWPPPGAIDFHWVSVKEVLAFIGSGLLDEFPPIIFDPDDGFDDSQDYLEDLGLVRVQLPWWTPPARGGPVFAYPAAMFHPDSYSDTPIWEALESPSVGVSVTQRMSEDEWEQLLVGCMVNSIAEKIKRRETGYAERFLEFQAVAPKRSEMWIDRWNSFF